MKKVVAVIALIVLGAGLVFATGIREQVLRGPDPNIVQLLRNDGRFNTLVSAINAADIADVLASGGPFTVFAPTDRAFRALPAGVLEGLLDDPAALTEILTYHVVAGEYNSAQVTSRTTIETAQGLNAYVSLTGRSVLINDAAVVDVDLEATNGVVHVIDQVITPPSLYDVARFDGRFNYLVRAIGIVGAEEEAMSGGPYTVFAPIDSAIEMYGDAEIEAVAADADLLAEGLLLHIFDGVWTSQSDVETGYALSISGVPAFVEFKNGTAYINGARVISADIMATNGVIHAIDDVALPTSGM